MSDPEIMICVAALDSRRLRGGDRRSEEARSKPSHDAIENPGIKSACKTADLLGVSTSKVERTRAVLDHADPQTIEEVRQGQISINRACTETQKKQREAKDKERKGVLRSRPAETRPEEAAAVTQKRDNNPEDDQEDSSDQGETVMLSPAHFAALKELGGSADEHVARAIDRYLFMLRQDDEFTDLDYSVEEDDLTDETDEDCID